MALLKRAMADIPRIEVRRAAPLSPCAGVSRPLWPAQQLEKDHPRMARLFNRGLLPFGVWEQLLEAEAIMDHEVHEVQAEALAGALHVPHVGWHGRHTLPAALAAKPEGQAARQRPR